LEGKEKECTVVCFESVLQRTAAIYPDREKKRKQFRLKAIHGERNSKRGGKRKRGQPLNNLILPESGWAAYYRNLRKEKMALS